MVKVSKIAVWDVDGVLHRDAKQATRAARRSIIKELMAEQKTSSSDFIDTGELAEWMADNWDTIEGRVEKAMAGT